MELFFGIWRFFLKPKSWLKIHLSTQASVANFLALKEYALRGVKRVVLARECKLLDIKGDGI